MFKMKEAENLKKHYTLYSTQYFHCEENYSLIQIYVKWELYLTGTKITATITNFSLYLQYQVS